jgi:hypothetical protein
MADLTKGERRRLSRYACGWCDQPLDRDTCGSIYGPQCSEETRSKRRDDCLSEYKPRIIEPASKDSSNE